MIYQDDLKCCPFCGSKPDIRVDRIEDGFVYVKITCGGCYISKSGHGSIVQWRTPAAYIAAIKDAERMAADAWNGRACAR